MNIVKLTRICACVLSLQILFAGGMASPQKPQDETRDVMQIYVDQVPLENQGSAVIYKGHAMVPVRGVFERLGATLAYDSLTRSIVIDRADTRVVLFTDSKEAIVNGVPQTMKSPPILIGDQVMVPLRFVSESFGALVSWDPETRVANILSRTGGIEVTSPSELPPMPGSIGHLISSVSIFPNPALPGQTVTVGLRGTGGGTARILFADGRTLNLKEQSSGYYEGTYVIPPDILGSTMQLTAELQMPDGTLDMLSQHFLIQR